LTALVGPLFDPNAPVETLGIGKLPVGSFLYNQPHLSGELLFCC
jgi:hypothetical protein